MLMNQHMVPEPLKRFITKEVETPVAKEIVAGHVMPKSKSNDYFT